MSDLNAASTQTQRTSGFVGSRVRSHRHGTGAARHRSELRVWLAIIDAVLASVEQVAWDLRAIADGAVQAWGEGRAELRRLGVESTGLRGRLLRAQKTGFMLARLAAGYRLFELRAAFVSERRRGAMLEALHERSAQSFYRTCVEQGGAFLKVGQLLSARADLLPEVWVRELSRLQDAAAEVPLPHVRDTIERELGAALPELFASFTTEPLAAASIGQVHVAVTHSDETVAVKVQRPDIEAIVELDLDLLGLFVEGLRASLPPADYETIVEEIRSAVRSELDYAEEAHATGRMAQAFADVPGVLVPRPLPELCSPAVLTTTFMAGRKITLVLDELRARRDGGDATAHAHLSDILGRLLQVYLRQILLLGTFQADPHPGNFLVTDDGELVLLDFGCTKELGEETRKRYLALLRAFLARDEPRMTKLFAELGFATRSGDPATLHAFTRALLGEIAGIARGGRIAWPERDAVIERAATLLRAQADDPVVTLPGEFVMLARVFGTLSGLFAHYRPDIDPVRHVLPVLAEALA